MTTAARMQGFFMTELSAFAARELGEAAVRRALWEAAVERALGEVAPAVGAPLDPTRPCAPEAFRELASRLARAAGVPADVWLRRFGAALFARLAVLHDVFFVGCDSAFDFLAGFERGVHDELRTLDPRLDPPRMEAERLGADRLRLRYRSDRGLAALAHGLLEGCLAHFGEEAVVRAEAAPDGVVLFVIQREAPASSGGPARGAA